MLYIIFDACKIVNANRLFIGSAKITCSWIIKVSFIYKDLIKNDRSRCNHGICESCWERKTLCVGISTGHTWNEDNNSIVLKGGPKLHFQIVDINDF